MYRLTNSIIVLLSLFISSICYSQSTTQIHGVVRDDLTDELLKDVQIIIDDTILVATSNLKGYFDFSTSKQSHTITARLIGYEESAKIISSIDDDEEKIFFRLKPKPIQLKEVTISGDKYLESLNHKSFDLLPGELRNIPQVGEPDAFRAMFALPGITQLHDFSTQLYIDGGNFDQTLIAIDGVPVYNPYHLGGVLGVFNSDFIKRQTLYHNNYPSSFGGYLSGIFNVNSKYGNKENFHGSVSIGLLSSKLFIEGPLAGGSFILSGRRTYFDLISKIVFSSSDQFPYSFSDYFVKYTYPIDEKNLISVSGFLTSDEFKIYLDNSEFANYKNQRVKKHPNWGNNLINIDYTYLFSEKNVLSAKVYYSISDVNAEASAEQGYSNIPQQTIVDNRLRDITGLVNYESDIYNNNVEIGFEFKSLKLNYDWFIGESELNEFDWDLEDLFYDFADNPFNYSNGANIISGFLSDRIRFNEKNELYIGLRISNYSKLNETFFLPSLKYKFDLTSEINFTASYNYNFQYLYSVKENRKESLFSPFSVYFLSDDKNNVSHSHNFNIETEIKNIFSDYSLEAYAYLKSMNNLASSYIALDDFVFEKGKAIGLDVLLKKNSGTITGWLGYSLSRSIKYTDKYSYLTVFDRTHSFKILVSYNLSESWQLTSFWTLGSGLPYTSFAGKYIGFSTRDENTDDISSDDKDFAVIKGEKNSSRLPAYHRLDIGITGSFIWGTIFVKPYLQVLNVYNNPNPFFAENDADNPEAYKSKSIRASFIVPTIGVSVEF